MFLDTTTIQTTEDLDNTDLRQYAHNTHPSWIRTQSPIQARELDRIVLLSNSSRRYRLTWSMGDLFVLDWLAQ